ncbi:hypothetical protein VTO73DRAFT_733 [Trametes versicolor]
MRHPQTRSADRGSMRPSPENVSPISDRPAAQARAGQSCYFGRTYLRHTANTYLYQNTRYRVGFTKIFRLCQICSCRLRDLQGACAILTSLGPPTDASQRRHNIILTPEGLIYTVETISRALTPLIAARSHTFRYRSGLRLQSHPPMNTAAKDPRKLTSLRMILRMLTHPTLSAHSSTVRASLNVPSAPAVSSQLHTQPFLICVVPIFEPSAPLPFDRRRSLGIDRRRIFQTTKTAPTAIAGIADGSNGDGSRPLAPTRTPNPAGGQQPASVSPAIPAVLVICCLAAVLSFCWWFRRRLRRSRRYVPLFTRLGWGVRPELVGVKVQNPRVVDAQANGCWSSLSPLALMKLPSDGSQGYRRTLPPASYPLVKRQASHRVPSGQTLELGDRRPRRTARPSKSDPSAAIQVAVFIAMPSSHLHTDKRGLPSFATDCGLPALHVGIANARCAGFQIQSQNITRLIYANTLSYDACCTCPT